MGRHQQDTEIGEERRTQILEFMSGYAQRNGRPASVRVIADGIRLSLTATHYHLAKMQKAGRVRRSVVLPYQPYVVIDR